MHFIFIHMFQQINRLNFWTKVKNWEYWPFEIVYLPIFFYWLYLSLKARSFFFFSAANPSIETGGMMGESKFRILEKIDRQRIPATAYIPYPTDLHTVLQTIIQHRISFPLIVKPDVGERGWLVEKLHTVAQLAVYLKGMRIPFLIQEYVDHPLELGLFYYRFPHQRKGTISSIVIKEFLSVTGDGRSTLRNLILANERARIQYEVLQQKYAATLDTVPAAGETRMLVAIGNHSRGTKFLNGNHLINQELIDVFDEISQSIEGFNFGRFDLRCKSLESLYKGEDIKIMELNGAGAEPAHIYDPAFSVMKAYQVLFHHWSVLYRISRENHRNGIVYMTLKEAANAVSRLREYRKRMKTSSSQSVPDVRRELTFEMESASPVVQQTY
jgi:hypothetical protein